MKHLFCTLETLVALFKKKYYIPWSLDVTTLSLQHFPEVDACIFEDTLVDSRYSIICWRYCSMFQEKAAKLTTCVCDGREEYNCIAIRTHMSRLCFHKEPEPPLTLQPPVAEDIPDSGKDPNISWRLRPLPWFSLLLLSCLLATWQRLVLDFNLV